jgi:hypothetical protein
VPGGRPKEKPDPTARKKTVGPSRASDRDTELEVDPATTSDVLSVMARGLHVVPDPTFRRELRLLLHRWKGTAGDGKDPQRSLLALDWLVRTSTPAWIELAGLLPEARSLRSLAQVRDGPSAERANTTITKVLELVQADAAKASEQLRAPLTAAPQKEEVGVAWSQAVDQVEAVARGPYVRAVEMAVAQAAESGAAEIAAQTGWNWAVSAADMAAQSAAWRAANEALVACVGAAAEGEGWEGRAEEAKDAAEGALEPTVRKLMAGVLELLRSMIDPR